MVERFFHTILITKGDPQTQPYQDAEGDYHNGNQGDQATVSCEGRAEVNSSSERVAGQNGDTVVFSYMIYLPLDCPEVIPYQSGIKILHTETGREVGNGLALNFSRDTRHCRIWV